MRPERKNDLWKSRNDAYDLAGHAVALLVLGYRLVKVKVTARGTSICFEADPVVATDGLTRMAVYRRQLVQGVAGGICARLAGEWDPARGWPENPGDWFRDRYLGEYDFVSSRFARRKYDPRAMRHLDWALPVGYDLDRCQAGGESWPLTEQATLRAMVEAEKVAVGILTENWAAVERLANALLGRESVRLSGRHVGRLLAGMVQPDPHRWLLAASGFPVAPGGPPQGQPTRADNSLVA